MNSMQWLVLGSVLLSVMALAVALVALRASGRRLRQLQSSHRRLENELAVVNSAAIGMGNRLLSMEKAAQQERSRDTGAGPDPLSTQSVSDQDLPYTQANQMFRMGMSVEQVSERCGLSRAEASLLEAMQTHSRSS